MADEHSPELKQLLTQLRAVLNESNRLTIEWVRYQGNFEIDFEQARKATEAVQEALLAYNDGPVKQAYAALGRYLVAREGAILDIGWRGLDSDPDLDYAAVAQQWYRIRYEPITLW